MIVVSDQDFNRRRKMRYSDRDIIEHLNKIETASCVEKHIQKENIPDSGKISGNAHQAS